MLLNRPERMSFGKNTRATAPEDPLSTGCRYYERSTLRDRFHWARLPAFVNGLVNQELLLRNEYLITENHRQVRWLAKGDIGEQIRFIKGMFGLAS